MELEQVHLYVKKTALEHYTEQGTGNALTDADWDAITAGHEQHQASMERITAVLEDRGIRYDLDAPPYTASEDIYDLNVVAGGDGTMLEAHPYIREAPVLGVNTDAARSDGGLHRFTRGEFETAIDDILDDSYRTTDWTRAAATFEGADDVALNEVVIGPDHLGNVAEYTFQHGDTVERHRNTGMIVATPAGVSGWFQNAYREQYGDDIDPNPGHLYYLTIHDMDDVTMDYGVIVPDETVTVTSKMNADGAIKFDGTKRPHPFPRGMAATIRPGAPLPVITETDRLNDWVRDTTP